MSLRSKIVLLLTAVVLAYAGLDHLMQRMVVYDQFVELERAAAQKDLDRVDAAIDDEVGLLARDCEVMASSEGVRKLIERHDPAQFEAVLANESLKKSTVHLVCVCDEMGIVRYSRISDSDRGITVFMKGFSVGDSLVEKALVSNTGDVVVRGIVETERAPILVAAHPIVDASTEGRPATFRGTLVIGRFFVSDLVDAIASRTTVDFGAWSRSDEHLEEDVRLNVASIVKPGAANLVEVGEDDERLNAYWCKADVRGRPSLVLRARFDRPITAKGSVAVRYALVSTIAAGLLLMLVLLGLVQRTVLEPLGQLTEHAVKIGNSEDFTKRIRSDRQDEVGILAREFDGMLERVAQSHTALVETARAAGMSEIATGVLHNVGNVLNSVNVSARIATERAKTSSTADLKRVIETLRPNAGDLSVFIKNDPRGKHLFPLLDSLADRLADERGVLMEELETLTDGIEHIKELVQSQQGYAGRAGVRETVRLADQIESAISITSQAASATSSVQIAREFDDIEPFSVDRHRLMEILVNLIQNARQAVVESGAWPPRVTIRTKKLSLQRVRIDVADNGVGIAPENLARVFTHGFTTKKNGHGFGLHASANAATEMGGSLSAHSDGKGLGATFSLEIPLMASVAARVPA